MFFLLFFFQAEDGIRDLVRSRGLGDVYKRQRRHTALGEGLAVVALEDERRTVFGEQTRQHAHGAVSYTHLTLPTSDLV